MTIDATLIQSLKIDLPELDWVTDEVRLGRLSQDFSWFSPVLKRQLSDKRADIAVRPRTEEEIRQVIATCARKAIPITIRGSGTGNYGQAVPLHGGLILDMSAYNAFAWVQNGVGRAQSGIRLNEFDKHAKEAGWELRWLPSTFRSATLGGLFGGGFGGAGSITYGPIAALGNVLGARVMTVEPEPKIVEVRSPEVMLLHHTYGTTGVVLELEVALAPVLPWVECISVFDNFDAALEFSHALAGKTPGLVKKEINFLAAPIPEYLTQLAEHLPPQCHAVLMVVAEFSEAGMRELAAQFGGKITYRKTADEVRALNRTLIEFGWNHTTLLALKINKNFTYIQSRFDPILQLEQVKSLEKALSSEVMMHLEFIRVKDGAHTCSGLQLVRFTTEERLNEIMQIYRDHGATINNPHAYIVEDGGKQAKIDPAVVTMKTRFDPLGLLNPGKLRSWFEREHQQENKNS